jgi:hypothetical protein
LVSCAACRRDTAGAGNCFENRPEEDEYLEQRRWAEAAALVRYARCYLPVELAATDPALFRTLREQITRFFLRGGDVLSPEKLAAQQ